MKKLYLLAILSSAAAIAQSPGGVSGVSLWLKADRLSPRGGFKDYSGNEHQASPPAGAGSPGYGSLNFNDAFMFDGQAGHIEVPYLVETLDKVSMFTAYQSTDPGRERALVSTSGGGRKEMEYGTANMFRYNSEQINYLDPGKTDSTASFAMYSKFDSPSPRITDVRGSAGVSTLYIGKDAGTKGWMPFKGRLPEFFIYRKILTLNERTRINSYLAVKYGITMPYTEYLSSKSARVWRKEDYTEYPSDIAGVARDRYSGLYQKQSGSTSDGGRLVVAAGGLAGDNRSNTAEFADQTFLVWGSDRNPLELGDGGAGYRLLKRRWKARLTTEGGKALHMQVLLKTEGIPSAGAGGESLCLLVDRSGRGMFAGGDTEVYRASTAGKDGYAVFDDVVFDSDGSGTDVFTFGLAGGLMAIQEVAQSSCSAPSGSAVISIKGGTPPYTATLTGDRAGIVSKATYDKASLSFQNLSPDHYTLEVRDAGGTATTSQFTINSFSSVALDIARQLTIRKGGYAEVDASSGVGIQDASYEWTSPNGFKAGTARVRLYEPGTYTVTVTTPDGCRKSQSVAVSAEAGTGIVVYPNPVGQGETFTVRVTLDTVQDVEIAIYDMSGRLLKSRKEGGKSQYTITESLSAQGAYVITAVAATEKKAFKLIVN